VTWMVLALLLAGCEHTTPYEECLDRATRQIMSQSRVHPSLAAVRARAERLCAALRR